MSDLSLDKLLIIWDSNSVALETFRASIFAGVWPRARGANFSANFSASLRNRETAIRSQTRGSSGGFERWYRAIERICLGSRPFRFSSNFNFGSSSPMCASIVFFLASKLSFSEWSGTVSWGSIRLNSRHSPIPSHSSCHVLILVRSEVWAPSEGCLEQIYWSTSFSVRLHERSLFSESFQAVITVAWVEVIYWIFATVKHFNQTFELKAFLAIQI